MMERRYDDTYYADLLYRLLPGIYRSRDQQEDLRKFLSLFGHELARLRVNMDQLGKDFFIDTCQDWVIPYIGDLLGTSIVFNDGSCNRADVKSTIKWRRQKGTLVGLEDIAGEISQWGTHAVEMFEQLVWTQHLNHIRAHAVQAVNLTDHSQVARLNTPFALACRSLDLRPADHHVGWYQIQNVSFFSWVIPSHRWKGAPPAKLDARRYRFHPLNIDQPLFAGGEKLNACAYAAEDAGRRPDICFPHADHVPIRGWDFHDNTLTYFGQRAGFSVYEDGVYLCKTGDSGSTHSTNPCIDFEELSSSGGMVVADTGLFGGADLFRISAVRIGAQTSLVNGQPVPVIYSPARDFAGNFVMKQAQGEIDTSTFTYVKGPSFNVSAPDFHHPVLVIAVERMGASPNSPECEIIVRQANGNHLLVYLPQLNGLAMGQPKHLYVADDGSTYYARGLHDAGDVNRNPDASFFGAFLSQHIARAALGQVHPRPGARPAAQRTVVYRDLCCWDKPLQQLLTADQVAIDPHRGRFMFPAGSEPKGKLTVDFRFGIAGDVGAGPFDRGELLPATLTVSKSSDAGFATIQAAINAAPGGSLSPVVIEVQDSSVYAESLTITNKSFPAGLLLQARLLETPVLKPPAGNAMKIDATCSISKLTVDGIVVSGGNVAINGSVSEGHLRFCSLDPDSVQLQVNPSVGMALFEISRCICGAFVASNQVAEIRVSDSILHHPSATIAQPEGNLVLSGSPASHVLLERVSLFGEVAVGSLEASNSILYGPFTVVHPEKSCVRYSRIHKGSTPTKIFRTTSAFPMFIATSFAHPAYFFLHPNTAASILRGAEEGGEMGAYYSAGAPWRAQNVLYKLDEYLPAGLHANVVPVLPTKSFAGVIRS